MAKKETPALMMHRFFITFVILFGFWILLSWHFDAIHLVLGLISSLLVAYASSDLLIPGRGAGLSLKKIALIVHYILYLAYSIVLANIDVAYRVLHPKMPIEPEIVEFKTRLSSDLARTILANSITLTPGTITVDVRGDMFSIHALSPQSADDLLKGGMENKLIKIFEGEPRARGLK
jgi:multicomponent Na+:H+ antiporter subunit E